MTQALQQQPVAKARPPAPAVRNMIVCGDSETALSALPEGSVDLVLTSPPYHNARPEYATYATYQQYLDKIGRVMAECGRLLAEGRFLVVNSSPVLAPRQSRQEGSVRLPVPFDLHAIITDLGFDFVDDIIWEKPAGAGGATYRGARFAADRQPLQYKPAPVTEYIFVYRKHTAHLIDWNLRNCRDPKLAAQSRIADGYEATNIWRLAPVVSPEHPAVFPEGLSDRVVAYYSFKGDIVLDPFAGSGTVGASCVKQQRFFVLADSNPVYVEAIKRAAGRWLGKDAEMIECVGTDPIETGRLL